MLIFYKIAKIFKKYKIEFKKVNKKIKIIPRNSK